MHPAKNGAWQKMQGHLIAFSTEGISGHITDRRHGSGIVINSRPCLHVINKTFSFSDHN